MVCIPPDQDTLCQCRTEWRIDILAAANPDLLAENIQPASAYSYLNGFA